MNKQLSHKAIVIGDSFNNTLGLIRSLGEARIDITLILVGKTDRMFVTKSRYIDSSKVYQIEELDQCLEILEKIADGTKQQVIVCTNDNAAIWVDSHEQVLSKHFATPMRGHRLGHMMNKDEQCHLAAICGFTIPRTTTYSRERNFPETVDYPILLKPINSTNGEKSDIHICRKYDDAKQALAATSSCKEFLIQEYIEKDYEINLIGISTDSGIFVPGGIRKIRHYPNSYSPCSFGLYQSIENLGIDASPVIRFIDHVGYRGPFSVELLHKGEKNYFMEVNFRHDGLAYVATASGANLPALLFAEASPAKLKVKATFMMDLSIDYCHVKDGTITFRKWLADFSKTRCQLNFNRRDPMPTVSYYIDKIKKRL